jgi:Tfp pilus assembly protein PilZ
MPFRAGQDVSLTFPLPDYQKYIKINGEVVRVTPRGIGVKFKMVNQDQEAMIKSLLEWLTNTRIVEDKP